MNPRVSTQFTGHGSRVLHALEAHTGKSFLFEGSEGLTLDHFAITFAGTREEVEERALPFRQGDEVLVEIVEPHMYDVDDAVAKIDGYIISIAGAAVHVGEKRMVRIDQVGRTAASALLLDESGEVVTPAPRPPAPAKRRPRKRTPAKAATSGSAPKRRRAQVGRGRARADGRRRAPEPAAAPDTAPRPSRRKAARMPYNPSLGVVAAGAGDAVRLPRPRPERPRRARSHSDQHRKAAAESVCTRS